MSPKRIIGKQGSGLAGAAMMKRRMPQVIYVMLVGSLLSAAALGARLYNLPAFVPPFDQSSAKQPLQNWRPFNIAHRGSNGEFPEETSAAYQRAIEEGADFIESDITATKDGSLICFHDPTLDFVTDVANHSEFLDRRRTYEFEGTNLTGFFAVDFTLEELRTLRARQRYTFRDPTFNGQFQIITFEHFITIALNADRVVGIYPEIKSPVFVNKHVKWPGGKRIEDVFVETLKKFGYSGKYLSDEWKQKPIFIQSFAPTSLLYISNLTSSPKVFLIDDYDIYTQDTNQSYWEITSDEYLDFIGEYVDGIGPWKDCIVPPNSKNYMKNATDLVSRAHSRHLQVHPYTYRNENQFLHFDFYQDPYKEYEFWIRKMKVDGLFTDFPGSFHRFQEWTSGEKDLR